MLGPPKTRVSVLKEPLIDGRSAVAAAPAIASLANLYTYREHLDELKQRLSEDGFLGSPPHRRLRHQSGGARSRKPHLRSTPRHGSGGGVGAPGKAAPQRRHHRAQRAGGRRVPGVSRAAQGRGAPPRRGHREDRRARRSLPGAAHLANGVHLPQEALRRVRRHVARAP